MVVSRKWVLVVDDDEDNSEIVVEVLQGAGYDAASASGGAAALRMIGEEAPALVLSDLSMRDMDGRELLSRTQQLLGGSTPPFVFLTGAHSKALMDIREPILSKPYGLAELLNVVDGHWRRQ